MRIVLLLSLLLPGGQLNAISLTSAQSTRLCETLLQTAKADVALPLNPRVIGRALEYIYSVKILKPGQKNMPLADRELQAYLARTIQLLKLHPEPEVREIGRNFSPISMRPVPRVQVVNKENLPHGEVADIEAHLQNELSKLPQGLLQLSNLGGRSLFVTFGAITQAPMMAPYKGVVPRGWKKPWDEIPGAGGGRMGAVVNANKLPRGPESHGSENLTLHEVLHNLDYACDDLTGRPLSSQPEFLRIWRNMYYRELDNYMRSYPEESFAEFGTWYYHSPQSREALRDLYPQWFAYFNNLKDCAS